jgi:transposase
MQLQRKGLSFKNEKIYVGFDVHAKSWKVTVLTEHLFHKTFVMPPSPEKLHEYLVNHFPDADYYSAYEAGFCGLWIHYQLTALGIKSIVVNPADIPTTQKEIAQKDDLRDSRKIAYSLRNGSLTGIYIPQTDTLSERSIVRMRSQIVKDLNRCRCRLKSYLYFHGIEYPERFSKVQHHWSIAFIKWIEALQLPNTSGTTVLNLLLSEVKELRKLLLETEKHIRSLTKTEKYNQSFQILTSIPGIGITTAMNLLTELEDINRFKNFDSFSSFVGLIPSTCSSGEKETVRGITFRGHRLRKIIVESAWIASRRDPALSKSFSQYCRRMETNKAIIRVARKLLCRIYSTLKNKQLYKIGKVS